MARFATAHATHPQWPMAAALVLAQLRAALDGADRLRNPGLGLLYITDHYAAHAQAILDHLGDALPEVTDWVGTVGVGVCASNVEYFDEPALVVMLCDVPAHQYRVFNGVAPLPATRGADGFVAQTALVHADGQTPELSELVAEMAQRTVGGYLFGGLTASRGGVCPVCPNVAGQPGGPGGAGCVRRVHGGAEWRGLVTRGGFALTRHPGRAACRAFSPGHGCTGQRAAHPGWRAGARCVAR